LETIQLDEADFPRDPAFTKFLKVQLLFAAQRLRKVRMRYKRVTDHKWVTRTVEPYSYRMERHAGNRGIWRFLYAYHPQHESIEKYLLRNVRAITVTGATYSPRWRVEIAENPLSVQRFDRKKLLG